MTEKIQLIRVNANIQWKVSQGKGGNWIGVCEPLKLTVQSETWSELMEDIGLTLNDVMGDLLVSNELPQFLREQGWQLVGGRIPESKDAVRFDVPFSAMMAQQHGPSREFHQ